MKRDCNLWEMKSARPEPALVSSCAQVTFAVRMEFGEYVDEISRLICIWVVFVLRFVSHAPLWADGGQSSAKGLLDIHQESWPLPWMYSSIQQTSHHVPLCIMKRWRNGKNKKEAATAQFLPRCCHVVVGWNLRCLKLIGFNLCVVLKEKSISDCNLM